MNSPRRLPALSWNQVLLVSTFLPLCWLAMLAVHELGHVVGAIVTGGVVRKVVLHPLAISRTDVEPNPLPLVVAWAGPLVGVLLPLVVWGLFAAGRIRGTYLLRFFAGGCLIANGLYLGVGSFAGIGDAGDLVRHGAPLWSLWLFGILTVPLGLMLWHQQGEHFGFAGGRGRVDAWAACLSLVLLVVTIIAMVALSERF